jgi:CYTH domain-containing protein
MAGLSSDPLKWMDMRITRQFLIAPSLARLIRRERGAARITEGHFPTEGGRSPHVEIDGETANLILVTLNPGEPPQEERTVVPRAHGEALLDVSPGKVQYARSRLTLDGEEVRIDRFVSPGALDVVSVEFESAEASSRFQPASWFGAEVTGETPYQNRSIAVNGIPGVPDIDLTDAALGSLIDALDAASRPPRTTVTRSRDERGSPVGRLSALFGEERSSMWPAPVPVPVPEPDGDGQAESEDGKAANLEIEDDVIRELANSLRPPGR